MSPLSSPQLTPATLPVFDQWYNPLPDAFTQLDGRNNILSNQHNRYLEMHPKGVRSVVNRTEYCILTIMILNFSSPVHIQKWTSGNKEKMLLQGPEQIHLIRSNKTGKYLCMDKQSVIYQSDTNTTECHFREETNVSRRQKQNHFYYRYYQEGLSKKNKTQKWYIEFNKDNSVRCGNSTSPRHKGANFLKIPADKVSPQSPPFKGQNEPCCTKKKCSRKKPEQPRTRSKRCKKLIRFCKKSRRNFFKLSLKKLRRYYKRCIKQRDEVRKCKKEERPKRRKHQR